MIPSPSEPVQGKLPEEIGAAIHHVVQTQQIFGRAMEGPANPACAKASLACSDALGALEATILRHLNATREALSRQEESE